MQRKIGQFQAQLPEEINAFSIHQSRVTRKDLQLLLVSLAKRYVRSANG